MLAAHPGNILSLDTAEISHVAAAIRFGIGVDELTIETRLGRTYSLFSLREFEVRNECGD